MAAPMEQPVARQETTFAVLVGVEARAVLGTAWTPAQGFSLK
jgi:hypothetical protein